MTEETVQPSMESTEPRPEPRPDPLSSLSEPIDHAKIGKFQRQTFATTTTIEKLKDWIETPMSQGVQRGLAMWAIGRHDEAVKELSNHASNPAIAVCLAKSHAALGDFDTAVDLLSSKDSDPEQAGAFLSVLEAKGDAEELQQALDKYRDRLSRR